MTLLAHMEAEGRRIRLDTQATESMAAILRRATKGMSDDQAYVVGIGIVGDWQKSGIACWECGGSVTHLRAVGRPTRCHSCADFLGSRDKGLPVGPAA